MKNFAEGVRWDLSDLYASIEDPKIFEDIEKAESRAEAFEQKYKPTLEKLAQGSNGPLDLVSFLAEYKEIMTTATKPGVYAQLAFSEKTNDPKRGAFLQKIQDRLTDVESHLLFWDVYWCRVDDAVVSKLIEDPKVLSERHYLEDLRKYAPYTLGEAEEKILSIKANTSGNAFSRLFDETLNRIPFFIQEGGKEVKKTESEVLSLLHSPDQGMRKMASESLARGLKENTHLLTFLYNMILADHRSALKIRKYPHPMDPRNLSNETDLKTVKNLIESVKKAYPLAERFYRLKKKLLGLPKLYDYDRYAPLAGEKANIDFKHCKDIVLSGYHAFSKEAGDIVEKFFEKNWIDAEIREGKQGGGFCCETTPDLHPYILVNYTGNVRDVMTVAHELGHGLHQYLAREVGILESDSPLTMAETASVFGEMLIFDKILKDEKDPKKELALLCGKIDDNFATVFRQIAMTDFELKAHEAGLKEGELPEEKLNAFWTESNQELYRDSVVLTENYQHGWKYIPHFVHTPFYCYAYAFAQLFVLTLYQKYKENPEGFVPKYLKMLRLGGSKKPEEIAQIMDLNIRDPHFWEGGLALLEDLVSQAESLAGKIS